MILDNCEVVLTYLYNPEQVPLINYMIHTKGQSTSFLSQIVFPQITVKSDKV